jgi:NAD(P)H-dependent flavin oxidoreductase YrpB (nitropropane dioxygenase family)
VSNEGGLGGIGSLFRSTAAVKCDIDMVKRLTTRPFAINHIPQALDAEAFRYTLEAKPRVVSFALADPGDLVRQVHNVGSLVMLQVTTVAQAVQAAERGVDVIVAQGGESGGAGVSSASRSTSHSATPRRVQYLRGDGGGGTSAGGASPSAI